MDLFKKIADQVIEAMQRDGLAPWQKPWTAADGGMPHNGFNKKYYRGINILFLMLAAMDKGYSSSKWLTFKQAKQLGGSVRKGEKGTQIIFWKPIEKEVDGEKKKFVIDRTYTVFNVEQCDGLPESLTAKEHAVPVAGRNQIAEEIIEASPVHISYVGSRACYSPDLDVINMPPRKTFKSWEGFYTTTFHELGHSTGHVSRLGRDIKNLFGDHKYSKEELVAEFCACMLAGHCGFERTVLENSAAYIKHWALKIAEEPRIILEAAQAAQKAADFLLANVEGDEEETEAA